MTLPRAEALYGAAYQVLYERLDPDGCTNRAANEVRLVRTALIGPWIEAQAADVAAAYRRALVDITKHAEGVLENNERAAQMREARSTIPVPPPEA